MPECPLCGSETRIRTRKEDGSKFYVCVNWPECRGKVAYDEEWEDDDWGDEKPVARTTQHRTPQRTARPRAASRNDLNWFQRNLHWTLVLAIVGANVLAYIVAVLVRGAFSNDAYMWFCLIGGIPVLAFQVYVGFWVLSRKERSFWWMLTWFIPFGWIVTLRLDDRSTDRRYTR